MALSVGDHKFVKPDAESERLCFWTPIQTAKASRTIRWTSSGLTRQKYGRRSLAMPLKPFAGVLVRQAFLLRSHGARTSDHSYNVVQPVPSFSSEPPPVRPGYW